MARSLRSKRLRKNKRKLREEIYEKVENERNERCSKRLEADDPSKFTLPRYTGSLSDKNKSIHKRKHKRRKESVKWFEMN